MHQPSLKEFAPDYDPLVEDVCSRDICCVDGTTPIQKLERTLKDTNCRWILTTSNDEVVGAISRSTVSDALQYSDNTLHTAALVEWVPDIAQAKDTLLSYGVQWSERHPLRIVQNVAGATIGVLDRESWHRATTRHMLTREDQETLLSNPVIQQISIVAKDFNIEVYIIGGWVRDFLLGLPSKDLDFSVVGDALQLATELAQRFGGDVHQFKDFGGAHWVISDDLTIDFTGARSETYPTLGSLPVVKPTHIDRDLQRRDFCINAMAIAVHMNKLGLLLDPMNGMMDLEQKRLRTLHGLSFLQDPTRIFRAARYSARFSTTLHPSTLAQLREATSIIQVGDMLSLTRIGIELEKIFEEPHPYQCWDRLKEWRVWTAWQPFWDTVALHRESHLPYSFTGEAWSSCWWMQLRLALSDSDADLWKDVISIRSNGLKSWNQFPNQFQDMLTSLQSVHLEQPNWKRQVGDALHTSTPTHWLLLEYQNEACVPLLRWWITTGIQQRRQTTGTDVLQLGVAKGPQIAKLLQIAQHIAWEGGRKEDELDAIRTHIAHSKSQSAKSQSAKP